MIQEVRRKKPDPYGEHKEIIPYLGLDGVLDGLRLCGGLLNQGLQLAQLPDLVLDFLNAHGVFSFRFVWGPTDHLPGSCLPKGSHGIWISALGRFRPGRLGYRFSRPPVFCWVRKSFGSLWLAAPLPIFSPTSFALAGRAFGGSSVPS